MLRAAIAIACLVSCSACGRDREDWPEGHPKIDRLRFLQQSPQAPFALQFSLAFSDSDGDLGGGSMRLLIDESLAATRPMSEVYASQSPPIAAGAMEGEVEVVAQVNAGEVELGERIQIGFVLEDEEGHESNDPFVVLEALMPGG